jgi:SAM-dependent methyltransferase
VSEDELRRRLEEARSGGNPTGWFEPLYAAAAAGERAVPWDRAAPRPLLAEWAALRGLRGDGARALVVGCGLGWDAELVAGLGFATVAFDVSETGIRMARAAHPGSAVDYVTADLLALPAEWEGAFDLVVECFTIQAMPPAVHEQALAAVCACLAPGGRLILIASAGEAGEAVAGPPWPLTRRELQRTPVGVLTHFVEHIVGDDLPHWRAELYRPSP